MIKNIFIVGTGRSGTHFLCRSLLDFSNINDRLNGKEDPLLLKEVTMSAINHKKLSDIAIKKYTNRIKECEANNEIFLDQHHPTIHNIAQLDATFNGSVFLGLDRPVVQIVASMMKHKGVQTWFKLAKKNTIPYPNKFLGVSSLEEIINTPLHMLCAKRVIAHKNLNKKMNTMKNFKLINFENFIRDKQSELNRVFGDDLELFGSFKEKEVPKLSVLEKYKTILSVKQIEEIQEYSNLHVM